LRKQSRAAEAKRTARWCRLSACENTSAVKQSPS
jgi:hypothetical protein